MDITPNLSYEVKIHSFLPNFQFSISQLKSKGRMAGAKGLRGPCAKLNWDTCGIEYIPKIPKS